MRTNNSHMYSHINSVGVVMFVEWSSRPEETNEIKTLNLVVALDFISQNFFGPGFWIPTKGI